MSRALRWRRTGCMLAIALAASACSGIPDTGPPQVVRPINLPVSQAAPQAPQSGLQPVQVVRGFVEAGAETSADALTGRRHAAAQEYLTPQAQEIWQRQQPGGVTVLDDAFRVETVPGEPGTVRLLGERVAMLNADRSYRKVPREEYTRNLHLEKAASGEWRISDPPADVVLASSGFSSAFEPAALYFLDATGTTVVPDFRYVVRGPTPAKRAGLLLDLLLAGPSPALQGAARTALGVNAQLRSNVAVDDAGVLRVDLTGLETLTPESREALAAQIVWTLRQESSRIAITVDEVPLDPRMATLPAEQQVYTLKSVAQFDPDQLPGTGAVEIVPYYIDNEGAIVSLDDGIGMWGRVGTGSTQVVDAALSAATGTLAAVGVTDDGGRELLIGRPLERINVEPALAATTLTAPTFNRDGDEVWVVQNGATKPQVIRLTTAGAVTRSTVRSDELAGKGTVTALALSPDGVRVAVVAERRLYLGVVVPVQDNDPATAGPPTLAIQGLQELDPSILNVGPVAFQSATRLVVGGSVRASGFRILYQLGIDGQARTEATDSGIYGDVNSVAVAPDRPTLMSFGSGPSEGTLPSPGTIWQLDGTWTDGRWVPPQASGPNFDGTAPFYPR